MEEDENPKRIKTAGVFITLPFVLSIPPIIGWFIGQWLDNYFGTTPYLMFFFIILGFIAGAREFYRLLKKYTDL